MRWLPWVLASAFALIAFVLWQRTPEPVYRDVVVTEEVIREVERVDTVVTFVEKVVWKEREPETTATATQGAVGLVRSFCSEGVSRSLAGGDSISPVRPVLLLRSVRHEPGWFFGSDRVVLTGPLSNGDLRQLRYQVRGPWQAHVRGSEVLLQDSRWGWVREGIELLAPFAIGYAVGAL